MVKDMDIATKAALCVACMTNYDMELKKFNYRGLINVQMQFPDYNRKTIQRNWNFYLAQLAAGIRVPRMENKKKVNVGRISKSTQALKEI